MPNRMLRDWTDSDKVNSITIHAERFFTRLIMKVDDYGCFHADTRLLKANLFPLLLDSIREADLSRWMEECQKAGLIVIYEANNKKYLQILDFKQRLDKARAKFPLPPKTENETVVNEFPESGNDSPAEVEVEVEVEREEIQRAQENVPKNSASFPKDLTGSNLFRKPVIPSKHSVWEYFQTRKGTKEMAKKFFEKYEATGWYLNNSPITNFAPLASKFLENWQRNEPQGQGKSMIQ